MSRQVKKNPYFQMEGQKVYAQQWLLRITQPIVMEV